MTASRLLLSGLQRAVARATSGLVEITHNGFAMLGLALVFVVLALTVRPEIRQLGETHLADWLQSRQVAQDGTDGAADNLLEPAEPLARATAADPSALPRQQASVAFWLSKKYRVAPEPLSALVAAAYEIGRQTKLEPTLILAIVAIESGFNPFAQSAMGAQGLMQVMTKIHGDKYESFGGTLAAFDPVTNLRVGVKVLQECIARAGSLEGGLRYYVGAANLDSDGGYASKVLAEHARLQSVAAGQRVPLAPRRAAPVQTKQQPESGDTETVATVVNS